MGLVARTQREHTLGKSVSRSWPGGPETYAAHVAQSYNIIQRSLTFSQVSRTRNLCRATDRHAAPSATILFLECGSRQLGRWTGPDEATSSYLNG